MCGVIGLVYENSRNDLGKIASELLMTLEYRGYDSTGAAIQGEGLQVDLRKGVGAPSAMVGKLGIDRLSGQVLCGQVRWATFGAVDQANAQPHLVRCKTFLYGAHNGNVTNCDALKLWLTAEGHQVQSDNDGEMVVHTVEHFFAAELARLPDPQDPAARRRAMRRAIAEAGARLQGSYAAVIADPVSRNLWAIKKGSSLYFGIGERDGECFGIASSDLTAVLKLTHTLVPLAEGELVEYDAASFEVLRVADGAPLERQPVESKLRAEDTALRPPFTTFMAQEIHAQIETTQEVVRLFMGGEDNEDQRQHRAVVDELCRRVLAAHQRGARVFIVCCGSSFHAAKTAALFFNDLAGIDVLPVLPGELRGAYGNNLKDGDVLIAVSQSGETKDLIDVINDAIATRRAITKVALVNNLNSTLAQEKSDLVIPLRCGPEIAVAATKSFINQLAVLYTLALAAARARGIDVSTAIANLERLPELVEQTLWETRAGIEAAADLLYLAPSIHLLATRLLGVAKEGALKIREVVLNHTEGFEASEFKHGPNTILGKSTVYGLPQLGALLGHLGIEARRLIEAHAGDADLGARIEAGLRDAFRPGRDPHAFPATAALDAALAADYPLVYVTGPAKRDVDLTISQINTHKIRGSMTVIVAEENAALRQAATKRPADNPAYRSCYVALPPTGDTLLTAFTATVALQSLALAMSLKKMAHLDALGFAGHGVHPDVPKNVSKSITVD
jgi:glucosamine--fructose-6-phosphate aminotransferase (isomerizing)